LAAKIDRSDILIISLDSLSVTRGWGERVWDVDHEVIERASDVITEKLTKWALEFARVNFRCRELSAGE
jgi:hypothetical protein